MRSLIPLMRQQVTAAAHGDRTWLAGFWIGALLVVLLTIPKLAFPDAIGAPTPFLLYFAAILTASYRGGVTAGLLTTVFSAVAAWWFFMKPGLSALGLQVPALVVFSLEGLAVSLIMGGFVAQRQNVHRARDEADRVQRQRDLVLSGVDEGIALQDPQGRIIYANQLAAENAGCSSPEELMCLPPQELMKRMKFLDLDGKPLPLDRLPGRRILMGEKSPEITVRYQRPAESFERWGVLRANALRDETGKVQFVVNLFRDVTETFKHEAELKVAREWFRTALRSIGDAVIATDAEGRVNLINPVAEKLTGWKLDEALGRPLEDVFNIIREDTRKPVESPVREVLRNGVIVGLANHTLLLRRDGSEIAIDDSAAPIRGTSNQLEGVILVFRDVSAKRAEEMRAGFLARATEELNSSLDYRSTLTTVARLAVPAIGDWCAVDILQDESLTRLAVAHVDDAKIEQVQELQRLYPSDPDATSGVHQILRSGEPELLEEIPIELLEASAKNEDHKRRILELGLRSYLGVPLTRAGRTFGVITLAMAESNRRFTRRDLALAQELADRASLAVENARLYGVAKKARELAESANRTKDEFLAMLGHELRNPLAPIRSALELIGRSSSQSHTREIEVIRRQTEHLVRLVDDLLDVARITNGRLELERQHIVVSEVVDRAREMVWSGAVEPAHEIHVEIEPGLSLCGDFVRISQVLANLLTNAVKYTPKGGNIWISARSEGNSVVIGVRDDGMGIGNETLRLVFDLFVQEPQALDRAQGGLGLGLAIVKGLVSAHGGSVTASSKGAGQGAEFLVRLPIGRPSDVEPMLSEASNPSVRPLRVLVVDDNEDACELLATLLVGEGHQVSTAHNGAAALKKARQEPPQLALLDIGLPDMSGYDLGRALRQLPGLEKILLIAITGYCQAQDRRHSEDAGFDAHLVKPVELGTLSRVMEEALPKSNPGNR